MAARVTQLTVEVLRSAADGGSNIPVSASHTITFGYTASESRIGLASASVIVTLGYTAAKNANLKVSAAHAMTRTSEVASALRMRLLWVAANGLVFADLASSTRVAGPGSPSTLLLLSYSAGENREAVAAATSSVNLYVASGHVRDLHPSASTSLNLSDANGYVAACAASTSTMPGLSPSASQVRDAAAVAETTLSIGVGCSAFKLAIAGAEHTITFGPVPTQVRDAVVAATNTVTLSPDVRSALCRPLPHDASE